MNDLERYFNDNTGNLIMKWSHYFKIYERHLSRFRDSDVHILEIGVRDGGSLQMWKSYFGSRAHIYGLDIDPNAGQLNEDQIEVFIGDQEDKDFLEVLKEKIPKIDIVIDDGGHTMDQQINTFDALFSHVSDRGVYICEDTHTSYWASFGGGYRKPGTFIEYAKDKVDLLNAYHNRHGEPGFDVTDYTRSAASMHFYDSMVVIEKAPTEEPELTHTGKMRLPRFKATRLPKGG
ncbi:MAG: class I SAM-dependent methyltransferase [Halioglobus sp.]